MCELCGCRLCECGYEPGLYECGSEPGLCEYECECGLCECGCECKLCVSISLGCVRGVVSLGCKCSCECGLCEYGCEPELCECGPGTSSKVLSFIWSVLGTDPET